MLWKGFISNKKKEKDEEIIERPQVETAWYKQKKYWVIGGIMLLILILILIS